MADLVTTRRSLHAVAELLLAGPQYTEHGTIKLQVTPGGIGTVRAPLLELSGAQLLVAGCAHDLDGRTVADVGAAAGLTPHGLASVYPEGCGLDETHVLRLGPDPAAEIHAGFRRGDEALAAFAPDQERVLWPEHFDLGVTVDEVNYGVSPGDAFLAVPYAYVGPWDRTGLDGPFWNAPFGAARPLAELDDLSEFFAEAADLVDR